MNRDAHVRAARRRLAADALTFEREREALLVEELDELFAEVGGSELDDSLFASMSDEEAALVRSALGQVEVLVDSDEDGEATDEQELESDDVEEEAARLGGEIESSRRTQAALSRYLELLNESRVVS